jgi:DNA-binding Lrp family transcriptional regulator
MVKAFIFINVDSGEEEEAFKHLRTLPEVKELYSVDGLYDAVAILEANSMDTLKKVIGQKVRAVGTVRSTLTTIVT